MDYTIQQGDTLTQIAQRFGVDVKSLAMANGIQDPNKIYAGIKIKVPMSFDKTRNLTSLPSSLMAPTSIESTKAMISGLTPGGSTKAPAPSGTTPQPQAPLEATPSPYQDSPMISGAVTGVPTGNGTPNGVNMTVGGVPVAPKPTTSSFADLVDKMRSKILENNKLVDQRTVLLNSLYNRPPTAAELASLDPATRAMVEGGNRQNIESTVRLINDQIAGRTVSLDKSVNYLTDAYQKSVDAAEKEKETALATLKHAMTTYGSGVGQLYSPEQKAAIKAQWGIDLDNVPSAIGEQRIDAQYGLGGYTGQYGTATSTVSTLLGIEPSTALSQVISSPENLSKLVDAMIKNEGSSPAGVKNNPGNIKFNGLPGQTNSGVKATDGGTFASYSTPEAGRQAIASIIQNAASGKSANYGASPTLGSFVDKYTNTAPSITTADASYPSELVKNKIDPTTGLTPLTIYNDAIDFLFTGKGIQSYVGGLSSGPKQTIVKNLIQNKASSIADSMGITKPQASAIYKGNASAIKQTAERLARVETVLNATRLNFPRLMELADKLKQQGINLTQSDIQRGSINVMERFGSPEAAAYTELIRTIQSDYGAAQAALVGSRGGQYFAEIAVDAIPTGLTSAQYNAIADTLVYNSENARQAMKEETQNLLLGISSVARPASAPTGGHGVQKDIRALVFSKGYDYDRMIADGNSDEEIRSALGL